jgi:hypothetical protein
MKRTCSPIQNSISKKHAGEQMPTSLVSQAETLLAPLVDERFELPLTVENPGSQALLTGSYNPTFSTFADYAKANASSACAASP